MKVAQSCPTLCNPMDCSPWNYPGQNTGMGSQSLLHGIFPAQGSNPGLLHCRQIPYNVNASLILISQRQINHINGVKRVSTLCLICT